MDANQAPPSVARNETYTFFAVYFITHRCDVVKASKNYFMAAKFHPNADFQSLNK